jgi:hypothetical protein
MDSLLQSIGDWIKQGLIDAIMAGFTNMFDAINTQVGDVASQIGQTPEAFSPGVFAMIRTLSETVIIPIAGMILTFILCYELITMIIDRNNLHDFESFIFFKWIFKTFCATYILTHTFDLVMAVFELAQNVVNQSSGLISGTLDIGNATALATLQTQLEAMDMWGLLGLWMQMSIVQISIWAMSICVFIIVYGRLIEIYMTVSIAPIPLATMANREWGQIGNNYIKALFALGFQGFLVMVCIAIYAVLIQDIAAADSVHMAIWGCAGYTALLCFTLFKTGSLSKSLFGAH